MVAASKKRDTAIAVAVKCSPQSRPGQPEVVFCQPNERRVWVQRGAQILFSSTFEVVLPSSATPAETYTRTAEVPVRHACGGGQACVICYGAHGSGKQEAMCAAPEAAADELGISARALQAMAAHAREHGLKLSLSAVQICFELATKKRYELKKRYEEGVKVTYRSSTSSAGHGGVSGQRTRGA